MSQILQFSIMASTNILAKCVCVGGGGIYLFICSQELEEFYPYTEDTLILTIDGDTDPQG